MTFNLFFLFLGHTVSSNNHSMISLIRLQGDLLTRLKVIFLQPCHLTCKYCLGSGGRVNAVRLNGNHEQAIVLEKVLGIQSYDTSLVGLRHIREDGVHHRHEHAVLLRVPGVLHDGDDIGALLGEVHQVATGSMRELHCVDLAAGSDHIGNVRHRGTGGGPKVQHLGSRVDAEIVNAAHESGAQLRTERVPDAVFDLLLSCLHCHPLLTVYGLAWHQVAGDNGVVLALCNEHSLMPMCFYNHFRSSLHSSPLSPTPSSASSTASST